MQWIHQDILKEINGDHKYLRCPGLQDNNFKVLRSDIAMYKVYLECAETVKTNLLEMIQ